jgi:hypothetical protein
MNSKTKAPSSSLLISCQRSDKVWLLLLRAFNNFIPSEWKGFAHNGPSCHRAGVFVAGESLTLDGGRVRSVKGLNEGMRRLDPMMR